MNVKIIVSGKIFRKFSNTNIEKACYFTISNFARNTASAFFTKLFYY